MFCCFHAGTVKPLQCRCLLPNPTGAPPTISGHYFTNSMLLNMKDVDARKEWPWYMYSSSSYLGILVLWILICLYNGSIVPLHLVLHLGQPFTLWVFVGFLPSFLAYVSTIVAVYFFTLVLRLCFDNFGITSTCSLRENIWWAMADAFASSSTLCW